MGIYIKGMEMPTSRGEYGLLLYVDSDGTATVEGSYCRFEGEPFDAVPVPPHGDLIDRDALIKDGWLNLHKEVMRMGGYAIHELPLINPSIPVIIPASEEGE